MLSPMAANRTPECLDPQTIAAFVAGRLDASLLQRVEAHVAGCALCRSSVADAAYGAIARSQQTPAPAEQRPGWASFVPATGEVIADKYRIEVMLGHGGMGAVLAARHVELGHRVAIKILHQSGPSAQARLLREAQTCARLTNDHIARVFDVGRLPSGDPYIVMEYLAGEDLSKVATRGPLPIGNVVGYVMQACAALIDAHAAGIVHRDLKPANLFLTTRTGGAPLVKVLDFGISKMVGEDLPAWHALTSTGMVLGSPLYMSPEQIRAAPDIDFRTDIWSLGVILYELIVGRPPFSAPTFSALCVAIATERAPPPSSLRYDVPPGLADLILRCLAKDRAQRFGSAAELMAALAPFASAMTPALEPAHPAPRPLPPVTVTGESSVISQTNRAIPGLPSWHRGALLAGVVLIGGAVLGTTAIILVRASATSSIPEPEPTTSTTTSDPAGRPPTPSPPPPVTTPSASSTPAPPASSTPAPSARPAPPPKPPPKKRDPSRPPPGPTDTPD
jgi:eukaryotic-like serine/threonine-protein kinase